MFGGKQGNKLETNGNLFIVNIVTKQLTIVSPPNFISEKNKIWGSSSAWISGDTLLLMSLLPPGYGERSIFMYSSKPMDILTCALDESCKVVENVTGNIRLNKCDVCGKYIHYYCNKKITN